MIILKSTYKVDAEILGSHLDAHLEWVDKGYESGIFVASGLRDGGVGAVILARGLDAAGAEALLAQDPFVQHGVADYEVVEFEPARVADGLDLA